MLKECTKSRKVYRSGGELGRPMGDLWDHGGSPDRVMGRIWWLGDCLSTALPYILSTGEISFVLQMSCKELMGYS